MSELAKQLAGAIAVAGTKAGTPAVRQNKPVRSRAKLFRAVLLAVSLGSHAIAVFLIARLLWKLRRARQHQHNHRRAAVRPLFVDRLQGDSETAPSSNNSSAPSSPLQHQQEAIQLEIQLQTLRTEHDALQQQAQALADSKKALEEEIAQATLNTTLLLQQNKALGDENLLTKEANGTLARENEALKSEVGRLTGLLDLNKIQDAFQSVQFSDKLTAPTPPMNGLDQESSLSVPISPLILETSTIDDDARSDTSSVNGTPEFDGYSSASSSRSTSPRRRLRQTPIIGMPSFMRMHPAMMFGQPLQPTQQH